MRVALAQSAMSAVLMTLFAVSIVGALGMAVYGLRVLVSRWEQPRRLRHKAQTAAPPPAVVNPVQPMPAGPPSVWVSPMAAVPAPLMAPFGMATPPPMLVPVPAPPSSFAPPPPSFAPPPPSFAPPPPSFAPPPRFMPPLPPGHTPVPSFASGPRPAPTWTPPPRPPSPVPRASSPYQISGIVSPETPRLARGSIPPDFAAEVEMDLEMAMQMDPDTDPSIPIEAEPQVTRGARFSVVRSSRRQ